MCVLDSFGFYLTRSKCTNIFWRKIYSVRKCLKYNFSSAGFCHRACLLLCVNPSQNAFKGWLANNVSCCKLSEQPFFPFSISHAIRGAGFLMESWAAHCYSKQCKVQREQSVAAQTQLEYWFEFLLWTWLCSGCKVRRKWWISNVQFSSWVISDQISEIQVLQFYCGKDTKDWTFSLMKLEHSRINVHYHDI